jgi:hypothetical protein
MTMITDEKISELLKLKSDGSLYHREAKDLEFKESFNLAGIGEYLRDFSAFANNQGGYLIFGVTNSPRELKGLSEKSRKQFNEIDEERISGFVNDFFSPYVDWESRTYESAGKFFGVFYVYKSNQKPVICKKDHLDILKNGCVYYRYAGRTQVIGFSELANIIENRVKVNNELWIQKVKSIGEVGPANVGILDTQKGIIEAGNKGALLIDESLIEKIKFIREGQFSEKEGAKTLKLVGEVTGIEKVEVEKIVKKRLTDEYPFSYTKLVTSIKKVLPATKESQIQRIIKENDVKSDVAYSEYNFRNKDQEDEYRRTKHLPKAAASLYNEKAMELILKILKNDV